MGEIAEFVIAADEGCGIGNAAQLADIGRQIADRETDPTVRAEWQCIGPVVRSEMATPMAAFTEADP